MTERSSAKSRLADLGLLYAAAVWGSTFVMVKDVLDEVDPVTLVAYRFIVAGLLLALLLWRRKKSLRTNLKAGLILGFILWLIYLPQTIGLGITTASNSAFITGMFVAFVPIFLVLVFRRKPARLEVIASIISLIGLWVLTGGMTRVNAGDLMTLITAMACALHLLYSDRYMKAGADAVVIACQQFLVVGLLSLFVALPAGRSMAVPSLDAAGVILFLALFPTLSAFLIQMVAQRIATPVKVALIFALEPVFAGLFAWTWGGEPFLWTSGVGGGLIFGSIFISGIGSYRRARRNRLLR